MKMKKNFHFECSSCPSQMAIVRSHIRKLAASFGFNEETVLELVLAVDEACTNIIRYAYHGKSSGIIEIDVIPSEKNWEVRLRDYGKTCDPSKLKGRCLEEVRPGGLGLFFIQKAFDEVHFEPLEKGTCLILRKKKPGKK